MTKWKWQYKRHSMNLRCKRKHSKMKCRNLSCLSHNICSPVWTWKMPKLIYFFFRVCMRVLLRCLLKMRVRWKTLYLQLYQIHQTNCLTLDILLQVSWMNNSPPSAVPLHNHYRWKLLPELSINTWFSNYASCIYLCFKLSNSSLMF